jgi:hypothetical protein
MRPVNAGRFYRLANQKMAQDGAPGAGRRRQLRETIVLILSFRQDALSHSMTEFIAVLNSLRFWCDVLKRMFASSI